MDKGAWWATVHGITESDMTEQLTLSLFTFTPLLSLLLTDRFSFIRHERSADCVLSPVGNCEYRYI